MRPVATLSVLVGALAIAGCGLIDAAGVASPPFALDTECGVGEGCSCLGDGCECDVDDLVCRCLAPDCVVDSEPTGASCEGDSCECSAAFCTTTDEEAIVRSEDDDTCVGASCACDANECVCPDGGCVCEDAEGVASACDAEPID